MPTNLKSSAGWVPLIIRLGLGIIFIAHGSQKLFGAFGGPGISGTTGFLRALHMNPPIFWAWILALGEFFSGIGALIGLFTGFASSVIIIIMSVGIATLAKNGFFLPRGFEYNFAIIMMSVSLILSGPGKFSIDRIIGWKF